ncbi:MAG: OmpH family outer membrane protein [Myxococcota bacterium]
MLSRMTLALVAICVLLASSVSAETGKIGIVDTQQAIVSTEMGKKAKETLEQKLRSAQSQLQPKIERLQQMEKELQEMQAVLSKEARQKKQFDIVELKSQLETEMQGFQQQIQLDEARLMQPLVEKFQTVVDEIGRSQGYAVIFDRQTPGIMYSREALDITDLAVAEFDKKD